MAANVVPDWCAIEATYTGEDLGDMSSIENPETLEKLENAE